MIDLIDITIPQQHTPFGNERIKRLEDSPTALSKRFSKKIPLHGSGATVDVTSLNNGSAINIHCCPLKPLQGHNVFGTNKVCQLGGTLICAVLDKLEIVYTEKQRAAWMAGDFDIRMLDITHRFQLPDGVDVQQLCEHMLRTTSTVFRPAWFRSGVGVRMAVPLGRAAWIFYDKLLELDDKRTHSEKHLRAIVGENVDDVFSRLREEADGNIRAELKLSKEYLEKHGLNRGSAWTLERVQEVYFDELAGLGFENHQPIERLMTSAAGLKHHLRRTFKLWGHRESLRKDFKPSTLEYHRAQIRSAIGIDILCDVPVVEALPLSQIFSPENIMPTFPGWIGPYREIAFGAQRAQGKRGVTVQLAGCARGAPVMNAVPDTAQPRT